MAKRLVIIAKELNVGTTTIVDYLTKSGFEIENKPTAKVTDEMYEELLLEFSNSIAEKEKADRLIIGSRSQSSHTDTVVAPPIEKVKESKPEPSKEVKPPATQKEDKEDDEKVVKRDVPQPQLKVVGKIEIEKQKAAKEEEKEEEEKQEEVTPKKDESDKKAEKAPAEEKKVDDELLRAETPQLQGLKIMGKIDEKKLKEPQSKKPKEKASDKDKDQDKQKKETRPQRRKRKRKKITADVYLKEQRKQGDSSRRRSGREEPAKEVSQKEIEEKIKATMARISGGKSKRQKIRRDSREIKREKQEAREHVKESGKLQVTEFISVSELASIMDVSVTEVITTCMNLGVIVSINQRLDAEIIELVTGEFGHEVEFIDVEEHGIDEEEIVDDPKDLIPRAPIVTVMGHVDHGKTSLLDYIRKANVVGGEAGGITQHIGAYEVTVNDKSITFLDTPGHEAFTAMRARGAKVTDVVVIIVAADDKIMPQTKEAISHAQAAGVPIIFAINKVDKDGADPERIKKELASLNFLVEEWGGKYQSQDISAKTGQGVDSLLEKIALEAELLELKANPDRESVGTVIEASLDKGRGYVTKVLVQSGTLNIGDILVAGSHSGKVKAMFNEVGKRVKSAGPSRPVLILGLSGAPQAGEKFREYESEQEARSIATKRQQIEREQSNRASKRISLDEIGRRLALGNFKELNLIVKGDVDGSVEALGDSLIKLSVESIQVNVIHKAVGQIVESDVLLASASDAIIIGFQVRPSMGARNLAEREGVEIKTYSIIYEAIEVIKMAMEGMLEPTKEEKINAQLEVRELYKISKVGTIAGCFILEGVINRNSSVRVIRDGIVVYPTKEGAQGELSSLKRFKDDAKEVKSGLECGVTIKNFNDFKVGDNIEAYEVIEIKQTLD